MILTEGFIEVPAVGTKKGQGGDGEPAASPSSRAAKFGWGWRQLVIVIIIIGSSFLAENRKCVYAAR